jgi:hypothetical protein
MPNYPYTLLLISHAGFGACRRLREAWADPEHAAEYGVEIAGDYFRNTVVEVVVLHTRTRQAVITRIQETRE